MTDIPEKDYQKLCPGDKRNITENLRRFLLVLYDIYGPNYHGEDSVGQIILSKQEIIKDFVELMRSEVRPYINVASKNQDISSNKLHNQLSQEQNNDKNSPSKKEDTANLSNEVISYITSMIQDTVSKQLDEKLKPIIECLDQYEEIIRIYKEREAKLQDENRDDYSDLYANGHNVNLAKADGSSKQKLEERYNQEGSVLASNSQYSSSEQENVKKSENIGLMTSLPDDIQERIRAALNIYNEYSASDNFVVGRKLKKIFDKPIIRLVLPNEEADEFANKPIKDLKNDKTYQTVFLKSTDGSNDYIAISVGENIYAVFPVKFEPYDQSFAWTRAYPLFFEILPNEKMEAHSYILKQPAFFKKKDGRYQMLENGKGCIELVP